MLENKIEELTIAINKLTEFLQGVDLKQEIKQLEQPDDQKSIKPEKEKSLTHDDLKAACLSSAREDVANKAKVKALLKEFGANKAVDVPEDKIEEVIGRIESGEF